jgi:hypothetical protein
MTTAPSKGHSEPLGNSFATIAGATGGIGLAGFSLGTYLAMKKMNVLPEGTKVEGYATWSEAPFEVKRNASRFALRAFGYGSLFSISAFLGVAALLSAATGVTSVQGFHELMRPSIKSVNTAFDSKMPKVVTGKLLGLLHTQRIAYVQAISPSILPKSQR